MTLIKQSSFYDESKFSFIGSLNIVIEFEKNYFLFLIHGKNYRRVEHVLLPFFDDLDFTETVCVPLVHNVCGISFRYGMSLFLFWMRVWNIILYG